jgi:hypothetical protein
METADTGGGGGFCTLDIFPPHPARTAIITADGSARILIPDATASLLSLFLIVTFS